MTATVFGYPLLINIDFYDFITPFFYQSRRFIKLERVFCHVSKFLEVCQEYSAARRICNCLSVFGNAMKDCLSCLVCYSTEFTRAKLEPHPMLICNNCGVLPKNI